MCGRYRRTTSEEELARLYHIPIPEPGRFADQLQHRAESEGPGNSLQPEKSAAFARRLRKDDSMTPNRKLTNVIKERIVQDLQMNATEVSMRFSDGSTMHVKVMESNSPPLKNGARIRAVAEQSVTLIVSCEDKSQIVLTLADPGSSVTVRDANGKIEYLG
jgi:hypothetical protein